MCHRWVFILQLHQRLELEIERMKQIHQKELEDKEEELEDVRQSCQRRVGWRRVEGRCWVLPPSAVQRRSRSRGVLPPRGSFLPRGRRGGRALVPHHQPGVSPARSPAVQNRGLGEARVPAALLEGLSWAVRESRV